ncbi:MAG: DUF2059 domain-containing protein [Bryobacteraceae bacterium]|jgi:hypothetical protein
MRLLCAVFSAALLLSIPARADDATKKAKIEELMKASNVDQVMKQVFDQMRGVASAQFNKTDMSADARKAFAETQDRVMALVEERMGKMKTMLVQVYADTYTEEEVDGILAFYKSPAGQAMLQKMPQLMQRSMAVSQQLMSDLMPEIQKMAKEAGEKAKQNDAPAPPK